MLDAIIADIPTRSTATPMSPLRPVVEVLLLVVAVRLPVEAAVLAERTAMVYGTRSAATRKFFMLTESVNV